MRASYSGSVVWRWAWVFFSGIVFSADVACCWVFPKLGDVSELVVVATLLIRAGRIVLAECAESVEEC